MPEPLADGADFLLRIKGDSMVNAGILDGDTVVVQRRQDARNGEIVVALAGDDETADEATVGGSSVEDGSAFASSRERRPRADLRAARRDPGQGRGVFRRLPWSPLNRTLDQELVALMRGQPRRCPVCGEFVLRSAGAVLLPVA